MGTDNLFKKRRKAREKRKYEFRTPKANSYLIVTEGTRTEPLYFNGIKKGYRIAWSNQSFEYWLYLHFNYSDSALHRDAWNKKLDEIFKQFHLGEGKYKKNDKNIYFLVDTYQGVKTAIQHAKRRMAQFDSQRCKPSVFDPGTTVYQLVEELKRYLDE